LSEVIIDEMRSGGGLKGMLRRYHVSPIFLISVGPHIWVLLVSLLIFIILSILRTLTHPKSRMSGCLLNVNQFLIQLNLIGLIIFHKNHFLSIIL
jgi:hypothetical protein